MNIRNTLCALCARGENLERRLLEVPCLRKEVARLKEENKELKEELHELRNPRVPCVFDPEAEGFDIP